MSENVSLAQNGTTFGTMDELAAEDLLLAVVRQAAKDVKRRTTSDANRRDAAQFLAYLGVSLDRLSEVANMEVDEAQPVAEDWQALQDKLDELNRRAEALARTGKPEARPAQAAPPALPPSPFEGMTAEALDRLGVSPAWAGMTAQQLDELSRRQAHAARAAALGVLPQYLPMEDTEND